MFGIGQVKEKLLHSSGAGEVSPEVRKALTSQYHLDTEIVSKLRCVSKDGFFAGQPVKNIRLFDPTLLGSEASKIRKYDELTGRKEAILFEGNIDKEGHVYLVDRRAPNKARKFAASK